MGTSVFVLLHGPAGNQVFVRKDDVIFVMEDIQNPEHTLIYLSSGQQWTVKETPQQVTSLVHV